MSKAVTSSMQVLSCTLETERYAIPVRDVREVLEMPKIIKIPNALSYMCGIINLRGCVVPVIDLKEKFNLGKSEIGIHSAIIVIEHEKEGEEHLVGLIADSVHEVIEIPESSIENPPEFGLQLESRYLRGLGKINDEFILLLDLNHIMNEMQYI